MVKLFTRERNGFGMRAETDGQLAARVDRHVAEAHADLAANLGALPDEWRSHFAKRLAGVSTTTAT
jgi:hypothetical protein